MTARAVALGMARIAFSRGRGVAAAFPGLLAGTLVLFFLFPALSHAETPAGTLIHNVATMHFGPQVPLYSQPSPQTAVTVGVSSSLWEPMRKSVSPAGSVAPGTTLTYTHSFGNGSAVAVANAVLTDVLDPHLVYIEGSATLPQGLSGGTVEYDPGTRTITWRFPSVPAGYTGEIGFRATVDPSTVSDTTIPNTVRAVSDQTPDPRSSNTVNTAAVEQPLKITISPSRTEAEVGDVIVFVVRVENGSETLAVDNAAVSGVLPFGFRYARGTSFLDNVAVSDPAGGRNPSWSAGALVPGQVRTLKFRAIVLGDALRGDGIGRASVTGRSPGGNALAAGPAMCRVKVLEGVLGNRGIVLGRVFLDRDGDRMPGEDERGFEGVRIYLEDGTYAETDGEGKYSILGLRAGEHVLKLDRSTLPPGLVPVPMDSTFAGDGGSRFASLPLGGNARGDFALVPAPGIDNDCRPWDNTAGKDSGRRTGRGEGEARVFGGMPAEGAPSLEVRIQGMPSTPEILEPGDGAELSRGRVNIAVRVPEGAADVLRVNGVVVSRKSIGKTIHESARKIVIYEYIGVNLRPGPNTISLEIDANAVKTIAVNAPGPPARIVLSPEKVEVGSDGKRPVPVAIALVDSFGKPLLEAQIVTVELAKGKVAGEDLDPSRAGHQVRVERGKAVVSVAGKGETGEETLKVHAGTGLSAEAKVFFVPTPRPWVVAGIANVTAGANQLSGDTSGASDDLFKDGFAHDERIALFAKGTIGNGYLLTGSYDSGKEKDTDPLFQETDPAKYYPMTGDAGKTGYDASSQDKLYLKLEKGRSYALYGDYRTDMVQTDFTRYDRAFTGAKTEMNGEWFSVKAFGAESDQFLAKDEIRGNGTSGFYFLRYRDIVEGSERVRIEVRDRYHPERVLKVVDKTAYTDYSIDYVGGTILFKEPVPSFDMSMNPVWIVALYESQGTIGEEFYTYGGRAAVRPFKGFEAGVTAVREDRNLETATLTGADASLALGKKLKAKAEIATTDTQEGKGTAWQVEAEGSPTGKSRISAYYRNVDEDFRNLSSQTAQPGTVKYGVKGEYQAARETSLKGEGYVERNDLSGTKLSYLSAGVGRAWDNVSVETGYRFVKEDSEVPEEEDGDSHSVYAAASRKFTEKFTGTLRHTQIVAGEGFDEYETETAALLEYRLSETTKLLGGGNFEWTGEKRQALLLGMEHKITDSTQLTSRYEIENIESGSRMQSLIGLNHQWSPRKGLKLDGRAEWVETLSGTDNAAEGIALAAGVEYLPDNNVKTTGRVELKFGNTETTALLAAGVGWKVKPDLGLLARVRLWRADRDGEPDSSLYDALVGVAYRPLGVRSVYVLDTVRVLLEKDGSDALEGDSRRIVTSNDVSWRVHQRLTLSGKYAGKYAWDSFEGEDFGTYSDLVVAGATYDLTDRWDVGAHARMLTQYSADTREISAIVRAGYRVVQNLYASAGYNFAKLNDKDFGGWQSHGPFVELKVKFDEATLHLPGWDKKPAPPVCPPKPVPTFPTALPVDREIDVVGSVEVPALLVNGYRVPLPGCDAVLVGQLPDGSLQFEGSGFYEPVKFRVTSTDAGAPSGWNLAVLDGTGSPVRSMSGGGEPPETILWDGKDEGGKTVEGGAVYRYRVEVSYADNSVSLGGMRDFAVNRISSISLNLTGSAFKSGSAVLSEKAKHALTRIAEVLKKRPEERVVVEGHTDDRNTEEYNMDLSRRRAQAAADYLVRECGVPAERFDVLWYGESKPLAPNDTPEGREINRRVELKGEFQEKARATVLDQYRQAPAVKVNGNSLPVDDAGRFRTKLPAATEKIDLELAAADGRTVRTVLPIPSIRIGSTVVAGRIVLSGRTEPGNNVERDGRGVPVSPDGSFEDTVDPQGGYSRASYIVKNPAGVVRILHLDVGYSGGTGKAEGTR